MKMKFFIIVLRYAQHRTMEVLSQQEFHKLTTRQKAKYLEVPFEELNSNINYLTSRVMAGMHLRHIPDQFLTNEVRARAFLRQMDMDSGCWCCNELSENDEEFLRYLLNRETKNIAFLRPFIDNNESIQKHQNLKEIYEKWKTDTYDSNVEFNFNHEKIYNEWKNL